MTEAVVDSYLRLLARWVSFCARRARLVVVLSLVVTAASLYAIAATLGIDTDTEDMLDRDLEFRQVYADYKKAFPQFSDSLVIVVDAISADRADDAARRLAAALARDQVGGVGQNTTDGDINRTGGDGTSLGAEGGENGALFRTVFYPAGNPFFRRNGLLYLDVGALDRLLARLASSQALVAALARNPTLEGFADVIDTATREIPEGRGDPSDLAKVFDALRLTVDRQLEGRPGDLPWREIMESPEDIGAARRQLIVAQPVLDYAGLAPAEAAIQRVRDLAAALGLTPESGVTVRVTGAAAMETEELESVARGAGIASLVSLALVIGLLAIGLRSGRLVVATAINLVVGLIWTTGFAALAVGDLNLISVAFAVLFIGLGIDFGIHYTLRFREERIAGRKTPAALGDAAATVGGGLTLSALAAAVGFLSFVPTSYVGISELGIIASAGMAVALFTSVTLLPALIALMPPAFAPGSKADGTGRAGLVWLRKHPKAVASAALAAALGSAALLPGVRFDFDPLHLRDPHTESVATLSDLITDGTTTPYTVSILRPDRESAVALARDLARLATVKQAITIADFVPGDQDVKLGLIDGAALYLQPALTMAPRAALSPADRARAFEVLRRSVSAAASDVANPDLADAAGELSERLDRLAARAADDDGVLRELERRAVAPLASRLDDLGLSLSTVGVEEADLPAAVTGRYVAADGRFRIEVVPEKDLRDQDALAAFVADVRRLAPDATDAPVLLVESGKAVVTALVEAFSLSLAVITLLLLAALKSLRDTLLVLTPLALAALLVAAATVAIGQPFNFANVIVLPLLLGLGVASGIHLVMRHREKGGRDLMDSSTPRAVLFSALTTIGSFASLAASSHRGTGSMGLLLTLAIGATLLCSLVVLPALLTWADRRAAVKTVR